MGCNIILETLKENLLFLASIEVMPWGNCGMLEKVLEHSLQKLYKGADFDGKITKIENGHALFRAIFFYEFKLGRSAREAADNINRGLGPGTTNHATVSCWYQRFTGGDMSFDDRPHTGRPDELNNSALERALLLHPSSTTRELAEALGCSNTIFNRHLHDLGYHKVLAAWTPYKLSDGNRAARLGHISLRRLTSSWSRWDGRRYRTHRTRRTLRLLTTTCSRP